MYKPSTYLVVTYFPTYLPIYETLSYRIGYQGDYEVFIQETRFMESYLGWFTCVN
jgi:hypothetical protein